MDQANFEKKKEVNFGNLIKIVNYAKKKSWAMGHSSRVVEC